MREGNWDTMEKQYNIVMAGVEYVELPLATLLAQYQKITLVAIVSEKIKLINNRKSPIQDEYIKKHLAEKELNLTAILDADLAYHNTG